MNKGGTVEARGMKVTMVHADHSAGDWSGAGEGPLYLGEPVGFVIELEDGRRVYFAGDTDVFGDMELHPPHAQAGRRLPADRRPLHDGPGGCGAGGQAARREDRRADPLRHVPDPRRDAGRAARPRDGKIGAGFKVLAPQRGVETALP